MLRSGNRFADSLFAATSGCALIAGMAAIDGTVRGHITNLLTGDHAGDLAIIGARAQSVTRVVFETAGYYRAEHAPLVFFGLAGLVLFLVMFRS